METDLLDMNASIGSSGAESEGDLFAGCSRMCMEQIESCLQSHLNLVHLWMTSLYWRSYLRRRFLQGLQGYWSDRVLYNSFLVAALRSGEWGVVREVLSDGRDRLIFPKMAPSLLKLCRDEELLNEMLASGQYPVFFSWIEDTNKRAELLDWANRGEHWPLVDRLAVHDKAAFLADPKKVLIPLFNSGRFEWITHLVKKYPELLTETEQVTANWYLSQAAADGAGELVELLLKYSSADPVPNPGDNDYGCLSHAFSKGDFRTINALLNHPKVINRLQSYDKATLLDKITPFAWTGQHSSFLGKKDMKMTIDRIIKFCDQIGGKELIEAFIKKLACNNAFPQSNYRATDFIEICLELYQEYQISDGRPPSGIVHNCLIDLINRDSLSDRLARYLLPMLTEDQLTSQINIMIVGSSFNKMSMASVLDYLIEQPSITNQQRRLLNRLLDQLISSQQSDPRLDQIIGKLIQLCYSEDGEQTKSNDCMDSMETDDLEIIGNLDVNGNWTWDYR